MIKKLLVLNGTEGHKFEVGKQYTNGDDVQMVTGISYNERGYIVKFGNDDFAIIETPHVIVFRKE